MEKAMQMISLHEFRRLLMSYSIEFYDYLMILFLLQINLTKNLKNNFGKMSLYIYIWPL